MTDREPHRLRNLSWLLLGMVVGAGATVGLAFLAVDIYRGEAPTQALGPPTFEDETGVVDHEYGGAFDFFVGGGVAVLDCDDDQLPDLYFAGGENQAALYRNQSEGGGELRFESVDASPTAVERVTGAYPLDVDSDGVTDLAVLRAGRNRMFRGLGDCQFENANREWNVDGGRDWTTAFTATWEDGETLPTIVFGNYLNDERTCVDHELLRPDGDRYASAVTLSPGYCALSALFSDWDRSGRRDLRLSNDRQYYTVGEEQLWRFDPGEEPVLYERENGWRQLQIWGMGIASHDLTGDGMPEVYLTSQGDNKLQTLEEGAERPSYEDIARERRVTAHRPFVGDTSLPSTAWHAEFDDVNNDGFMDLFVAKGNVEAMPEYATEDPNNLLLGQSDGTFVEAAAEAGLLDLARSRGGAVTDLNADGLLDVVVVERREAVRLWRNVSENAGNWLGVALHQDGNNRDAVGAWIAVRVGNHQIEREVTIGGGHAGGELGPVRFGLGYADAAQVRVQWPDGEIGGWETVDANQVVIIQRPE